MRRLTSWLTGLLPLVLAGTAAAQGATYGENGLQLRTPQEGFTATIGFRNQIRFTTPFVTVPDDASGVDDAAGGGDFRLNRSRLKVEGQAFSPNLTYRFQADFVEERVRDLNVTWKARDWLQVRAGWWKVEYLLERMQSSGSQQLVDRSILDRWFTLGRQRGVQVLGRVGGKRPWAGTYYVGAFRGVDARGGAALPVWLARYEWSYAGRALELEQGADPETPLLWQIGASVVRTESAYAFYSGSGVGATVTVPGLLGEDDQASTASARYRTRQAAADVALKWRGVSLQGEVHRKAVRANLTGVERTVIGGYAMGGVRASRLWQHAPDSLELTARVALVDAAREVAATRQQEQVAGATWYLRGHRSKLSVDFTRLLFATPTGTRATDLRTRAQWEFTF